MFKKTAIVLMLAGAGSVHATVTDLGIVVPAVPTSFAGSVLSPGPFNDIFSFVLPANGGSGYSILNFPLSITGVGDFNTVISSISLYSNADGILFNGDDTHLASFLVPGGNTTNFTLGPNIGGSLYLSIGGSLYLSIAGIANGSLDGLYNGSISVSPVPEPESYAMLLAGLGVIGTMVRRRPGSSDK